MARIRTIKPEFFTSDDICALSLGARLLYIGLWCEADRDGRLEWKPRSLKRRYLPDDDLDVDALCAEIIALGLVKLYGAGLAYIPRFAKHQHINPRETPSILPDPDASGTRGARVSDASGTRQARVSDAQGGREGKGKEGVDDASASQTPPAEPKPKSVARGSRLPADWQPNPEQLRWARDARPDVDANGEASKFRDFWIAKPGSGGVKLDWDATWRNWVRNAHGSPTMIPRAAAGESVAAGRRL